MSESRVELRSARETAARWLEEHGDMLYRFALQRVRSPHSAEDLVQETLLAGLRGIDTFDGRSSVGTWLVGILRHKILDYISARARQGGQTPTLPDDEFFDRAGNWKSPPRRWPGDPRQLAEDAEFRQVVDTCLGKLPRRMAELFLLRETQAVPTEELCKELGVTPTNVWSILHRARLRLRECLQRNWFDGPKGKGS